MRADGWALILLQFRLSSYRPPGGLARPVPTTFFLHILILFLILVVKT